MLNRACKCGDFVEYYNKFKVQPMSHLTGGRSRNSIVSVVLEGCQFQAAYNDRLARVPNLQGTITVKFAINECGKVVFFKL